MSATIVRRPYATIAAARASLALDVGFDPFLQGGIKDAAGTVHRRPTKAALAALGYPVDPSAAKAHRPSPRLITREEANRAVDSVATCKAGHWWFSANPAEPCPECGREQVFSYTCNRGHRWKGPFRGPDKCPHSGCDGYAV